MSKHKPDPDDESACYLVQLTAYELAELACLQLTWLATGKETFLHRAHWKSHSRMIAQSLITWENGKRVGMGKGFAAVRITRRGQAVLKEFQSATEVQSTSAPDHNPAFEEGNVWEGVETFPGGDPKTPVHA